MNPTRYIHSTVLLSLLALGACKKEEAPKAVLPEATQTGQNTAGAKVDGTVWLPVQQFLYAGAPLTDPVHKVGYRL